MVLKFFCLPHGNTKTGGAYTDCDYFSIKERINLRNERFAKDPLLYIHQTKTERIRANMQHQYRSKKEKVQEELNENKAAKTSDRKLKRVRQESFYEAKDSAEEESINKGGKEREGNTFKEMTLEEQLVYLTNRPAYAPRLTCEIKTDKRMYQGIILQYENEIAKIRSGKRMIDVPLTSIKRIRMLSL